MRAASRHRCRSGGPVRLPWSHLTAHARRRRNDTVSTRRRQSAGLPRPGRARARARIAPALRPFTPFGYVMGAETLLDRGKAAPAKLRGGEPSGPSGASPAFRLKPRLHVSPWLETAAHLSVIPRPVLRLPPAASGWRYGGGASPEMGGRPGRAAEGR